MDLVTSVKATYEVIGQDISDLAIQTIVLELQPHPMQDVAIALARCRRELLKIALADIINRLPNGYPEAEAAWARMSKAMNDEQVSIVCTDEMLEAYAAARHLTHDRVAARMTFIETYKTLVNQARINFPRPKWRLSAGYDPAGRQAAVEEGVALGRLTQEEARRYLPNYQSVHPSITVPMMSAMPPSSIHDETTGPVEATLRPKSPYSNPMAQMGNFSQSRPAIKA